jgi:iron complex outermembrane receptor protein
LELEARATLPAWDLIAQYTRTRTRDETTGFRLANVPEQSAAVWGVHKLAVYGLPGVKAGLGVRHIGQTWDGNDALPTPSATLVDAMVSWDTGQWAYALNVTNLADKTYLAACLDRGDCWYGTKRKAVLSATYRW